MIEIRCPRCGQFWYDKDEEDEGGRTLLCERCVDHVRYKRRQRGEIDLVFIFVAGVLCFIDLGLIALSAFEPKLFAKVLAVYGGLQLVGGLLALFGFQFENDVVINVDWHVGRWPLLIASSGMVCLLAAGAFLGFK